MTKSQLVQKLADGATITKKQAAAVLEVGSGTAARQGWQAGVRLEHLGYDAHKHAVEIKIEQRI